MVIVMPRRRNEQRQQRNVEQLDAIAEVKRYFHIVSLHIHTAR